jgi:hypothetical protein
MNPEWMVPNKTIIWAGEEDFYMITGTAGGGGPSIAGALLSSRRIAYINPLSKVTSLLLQRCCCLCHDLAHLLLRFSVLLDASVYARVFAQAQFPIVVVLHALLKALLQHSVEQTSRRRG